jgi:catechol 2,3-dioxygenase-like lactoylglutathione lyase family enzyme
MLSKLEYHGTIPASDLVRARHFYEDKLGLKAEESEGGLMFRCKNSWFLVYPTQGAGTAPHTLGGWQADDIDREMAELRARGVVFEEYDNPGLKTVKGVADLGFVRASWFKDSEGNVLGLLQFRRP